MDASAIAALLKKFDVALDQWKLQVLTGKRVIADIIATLYPSDDRQTEQLTDSLESRLQDLKCAHVLMEKCVKDFKGINLKLKARLELSLISDPKTHMHINNIFVNYEDILVWTNAVAQDLEEQLKMNAVILSNICHLKTRNLALFHQGVWTLQPALKPQSEHYISMLKHINQQEVSSR